MRAVCGLLPARSLATALAPAGRNTVYRFLCDPSASAGRGPEKVVVEHPAGYYNVVWRTKAACTPSAAAAKCAPPPPAPPPILPPANCQPKERCHHNEQRTWVIVLISSAHLHARPTGVHRTCGRVTEIELAATLITLRFLP